MIKFNFFKNIRLSFLKAVFKGTYQIIPNPITLRSLFNPESVKNRFLCCDVHSFGIILSFYNKKKRNHSMIHYIE